MLSPVVLITGCSKGGIGHALCTEFAKRGCTVYATSRRLATMDGVIDANGKIRLKELDVCTEESVERATQDIIGEAGRIDIVVSNAGKFEIGPILDVPVNRAQQTFDTNTFGTLRLARTIIPHMASRRSGLFVIVGSVSAFTPFPWAGIYSASKAALHTIATSLEMECRPLGVRVMLLAPGGVKSQLAKKMQGDYQLPKGSLYGNFTEAIMARMWLSQQVGVPPEDYARETVDAVLKKRPPKYHSAGGRVWLFYILSWLPRWLVPNIVWRQLGKPNKTKA